MSSIKHARTTWHKWTLVTYANKAFEGQQQLLAKSAVRAGATSVFSWTEDMLHATEFYARNQEILSAPRGNGYWLWKPYVILSALKNVSEGEYIVYYDCGRAHNPHRISTDLQPLLAWCDKHNRGMLPGVYAPEHGPSIRWTKRECFVTMECDTEEYWSHPQIQATFSVWKNTDLSRSFVSEWLQWCLEPGTLTDEVSGESFPPHPDFRDHRHDQSILTNLAIMRGVKCFGPIDKGHLDSKDINNLVDRIRGRRLSIAARTLRNRALAKLRVLLMSK